MSRLGKKPITIPSGVTVAVTDGVVAVKGPRGELKQELHPNVNVAVTAEGIIVTVADPSDKKQGALWGLFASLLKNMITGVTVGFTKQLEINGVGFKFAVNGKKVVLNIGYSHPVEFNIPAGVEIKTEGNVMTISGNDKQVVGETAAQVRDLKRVEPYKGKGIRYVGEQVKQKAGKAAGAGK